MNPLLIIALTVAAGSACQWLAWRIKMPAILPLLAAGFLAGPVFGWIDPQDELGALFTPFISLAVAVILFEGALTLNWRTVRAVRSTVRNLLSVGALVTWFGSAAAAHYLMGLRWPLALLFGALIIVTGPTVIAPLLRNVRPTARVANVLRWEGILIDPLGALVAYLTVEAILATEANGAAGIAWDFVRPLLIGTLAGLAGGALLYVLIRRYLVPDYLRDIMVLSAVLLAYASADALAHESGLMAVTVMGVFLANTDLKELRQIYDFKEKLTLLLVSALFILLSATITRAELALLDWRALLVLGAVILLVRPAGVALSALGSDLTRNERLFLAWIAPRGIVAAAVTSLFVFQLVQAEVQGAAVLKPLVFLIIAGTVVIQGGSAKWVAQRLGVSDADPQGFLIFGANPVARAVAAALQNAGIAVRLLDANTGNVARAREEGLDAVHGDILSEFVDTELDIGGLGRALGMTPNDEANALACRHFVDEFGSAHVYQLAPAPRGPLQEGAQSARLARILFSPDATYARLATALAAEGRVVTLESAPSPGSGAVPLFALAGDHVGVYSAGETPPAGSAVIALLPQPAAAQAPGR